MKKSLKISENTHLAVRFLNRLAQNPNQPQSLAKLSFQEKASFYFLQKIARPLKKAGLVKSVNGQTGGYLLGKPANLISLKKIQEAVDGPICLVSCEEKNCFKKCPSRKTWSKINSEIEKIFAETKVADMISKK